MAKLDKLLADMQRARQSQIVVGRHKLTVSRPTDMDALDMSYDSTRKAIEAMAQFVTGWENITELDLVSSGTSEPVPFHTALFNEWIKDHPEHWETLINGVMDLYHKHVEKREKKEKN